MSVESRAFLHLLQGELNASPDDARKLWNDHKYWTRYMIGDGSTRRASSDGWGAVGRVGRKLGYYLQAEFFRVDQIWYREEVPEDWNIEAYIEHENSPKRLDMTVRKLLSLGSGLKVVIAYPETKTAVALAGVSELIRSRHGTTPDMRLLIVFGFLDEGATRMRLEGHEFDGLGRPSVIQTQAQT